MPELVPAVWEGTVAEVPPLLALTMNPTVLKVVLQLLAALQLAPLGQHLRALVAGACSFDSVTVTAVPLEAAGWLRVVVATPFEPKLTLVAPRLPAEAASVAVPPVIPATVLVQGLELFAQAVTVTVLGRQARLDVGSASS